jgi:hypothetical protein
MRTDVDEHWASDRDAVAPGSIPMPALVVVNEVQATNDGGARQAEPGNSVVALRGGQRCERPAGDDRRGRASLRVVDCGR